jgi:hypothetical protein
LRTQPPPASDLRNPVLYLPLGLANELSFAIGRALLRRGLPPVARITLEDRVLPADAAAAPGPRVVVYERPLRCHEIAGRGTVEDLPESISRCGLPAPHTMR